MKILYRSHVDNGDCKYARELVIEPGYRKFTPLRPPIRSNNKPSMVPERAARWPCEIHRIALEPSNAAKAVS